MNAIEVGKRLKSGPVFLKNEFEGCVIRSVPGSRSSFFAKFPGEKEYPISSSSIIVTETLLEWSEITKEEYNAF
jgi:hypothetical protein